MHYSLIERIEFDHFSTLVFRFWPSDRMIGTQNFPVYPILTPTLEHKLLKAGLYVKNVAVYNKGIRLHGNKDTIERQHKNFDNFIVQMTSKGFTMEEARKAYVLIHLDKEQQWEEAKKDI